MKGRPMWKGLEMAPLDAKNPAKDNAVITESDGWRWYEKWVEAVKQHCEENKEKYQLA